MKRRIAPVLVILFSISSLCPGSTGQGDDAPQRLTIKTDYGALFVWNQGGNNFTLASKGKDVRPNNKTQDVFFKVDEMIIQIQSPAIAPFVKSTPGARPDDEVILRAHRDWESDYAGTLLGKIKIKSEAAELKNGRMTLYWSYDMPEGSKQETKRQVFLTTVNDGHVIVLNGAVTTKAAEDRVRQCLTDMLATVRVSAKPFDLQELLKTVRGGGP